MPESITGPGRAGREGHRVRLQGVDPAAQAREQHLLQLGQCPQAVSAIPAPEPSSRRPWMSLRTVRPLTPSQSAARSRATHSASAGARAAAAILPKSGFGHSRTPGLAP